MEYLLKHGENESKLARQSYMAGQPLPDFIQNAPILNIGLQLYLQSFFELDTERSHVMSITMIPWTSIRDYGKSLDLEGEDLEDFVFLIRQMDIAHTKRLHAESKTNGKP